MHILQKCQAALSTTNPRKGLSVVFRSNAADGRPESFLRSIRTPRP